MQALAKDLSTVERLREQIKKLQAAPRQYVSLLRTGIRAFDALLPAGGLPLGHSVELCGEAASGRTSLALRVAAAATRELRLAAYVDGPGELYPPAAAALGVDLQRLLIVRPKAFAEGVWSALQLARSGAFAAVVLDLTQPAGRLALPQSKKLSDAALQGGTLLVLLTTPESPADGMTRLRCRPRGSEGVDVEILRSRQGGLGTTATVSWEALYARAIPRRHLERVGSATPIELPRFHRTRSSELRNGPSGLYASRPGRDAPFPSLASTLGVHR